MKYSFSLIACAIALGLSACGSDNKKTVPQEPIQPETTTLEGKVFTHDYLVNAKVFLDINDDGIYTEGEPSTLTDAQGNYRLENISKTDAEVKSLVAQISAETKDTAGNPMPGEALLYSKGMMKDISTCSHATHYLMQQQHTFESAKAKVGTKMKLCGELADYIKIAADENTPKEKAAAARFMKHLANAKMAMHIRYHDFHNQHQEKLQPELSKAERLKVINKMIPSMQLRHMDLLMQEASFLRTQGNTRPAVIHNFAPATMLATDITENDFFLILQGFNQDTANPHADLAQAISSTGLFAISGANTQQDKYLRYTERKISSETKIATYKTYDYNNGSFELMQNNGFQTTRVLVEGSWLPLTNKYTHRVDDNSVHIYNPDVPTFSSRIVAEEADASAFPITSIGFINRSVANSWGSVINFANFAQGAKFFISTTYADNDIYSIYDRTSCSDDEQADLNNICNSVELFSATESDDNKATNLEQLITDSPSNGDITKLSGSVIATKGSMELVAELQPKTNKVIFYKAYWQSDEDAADNKKRVIEELGQSSWSQIRVDSTAITQINMPQHVRSFEPNALSHGTILFTYVDGFVRAGFTKLKDSVSENNILRMNKLAVDSLIDNVNEQKWQALTPPPVPMYSEAPCRDGDTMVSAPYNPLIESLRSEPEVDAAIDNCVEAPSSAPSMSDILTPGTKLTSYNNLLQKETELIMDENRIICQIFYGLDQVRKNCQPTTLDSRLSGQTKDSNGNLTQRWSIVPYAVNGNVISVKTMTEDDNWSPKMDKTKFLVGSRTFIKTVETADEE